MNAPFDTGDLLAVLERATDSIEPPHLAAPALTRARRRRTRRVGVFAAGGAALAVVTVLAVVNLTDPQPGPNPSPAPGTPSPSPNAFIPAVPEDVVQTPWDPMTVADLPWAEDSPLPRDLSPTAERDDVDTLLVAMLVEDEIYGFGPGQARTAFALPEEPIRGGMAALSGEGTRVAFPGTTAIWWRGVRADESWVRVDYPVKFDRTGEWGVRLTFGDDDHLLLQEPIRRGFAIDVRDSSNQEFAKDLTYFDPVTAPDGRIVATTFSESSRTRTLGEYDNADPIRTSDSTALDSLSRLSVSDGSIAAVRGVGSWVPPKEGAELNGLIALDRESLLTRAYLPIRDPNYSYTDAGQMGTVAWLDDDTVLVEVTNFEAVGVPSRHLFSWSVETGELRRVADVPHEAPLSAAPGAFD